jgi:hypothetical protein
MPTTTLTLDRAIITHPQARHIRRMRIAIWLYLYLLARLPTGGDTVEIAPARVATEMGLPEGTIRSWLGHLRKSGYVRTSGHNGTLTVTVRSGTAAPVPPTPRFFTVAKLQRALGEPGNAESLRAALTDHPDDVIRRALAGTLAVPEQEIKKSRTALFLYLTKRYEHETTDHPGH